MPPLDSQMQIQPPKNKDDSAVSVTRLCDQCRQFAFDILTGNLSPERWIETETINVRDFAHSQLSDLYRRSRSGCNLCKLMLDLGEYRAAKNNMSLDQGAVTVSASLDDPDTFWVEIPVKGAKRGIENRLEFYPVETADPVDVDLSFWLPRPNSTAPIFDHPTDPKAFELVRYWLSECCSSHISCRRSQQGFSPRRLVDVGLLDGTAPICLREDFIGSPRYVALSHCWGKTRMGITTKANLPARKRQISLMDLPATFRDAITIAQNLSIRYLWIDSLCIVQDSSEDWEINCSEMSAIYSNSILTIGALWAQSSQDGIFGDRASCYPNNIYSGRIISTSADREEGSDQKSNAVGVRFAHWDFETALCSSTLEGRGWVFQERILSPATLYYWTTEMYWECRSCKASESRPTLVAHGDGYLKGILPQLGIDGVQQYARGHYTAWYILLESYTRKDLTFMSDKYPAILGLIAGFRRQFSVTPVSGIWAEDFHRGILWHRWLYDENRPSRAIAHPAAPSWSWLAVSFSVDFAWMPSTDDIFSFYPTVRKLAASDADILKIGRIAASIGSIDSVRAYCKIYADVVPVSCEIVPSDQTRTVRGWGTMRRRTKEEPFSPLSFVPDWDFDSIGHAYCVRIASWQHVPESLLEDPKCTARPTFAYYLVIQRTKDTRRFRSSRDIGAFVRIGVGAADPAEVDSFFAHSSRRLLKLV